MLARSRSGFLANFLPRKCTACSNGRLNSQQMRPSANIFLQRSTDLLSMPNSLRLSRVSCDSATGTNCTDSGRCSSVNGLSVANPAFSKSLAANESVSKSSTPSGFSTLAFTLSAAGFIATSTSAWSPGVCTSAPTCT